MRMALTNIHFLAFMLLIASLLLLVPCGFAYSRDDDYGNKKQDATNKPNFQEKFISNNIGIQGLVYCKSGSKLIPLEGAVTRITCEAADEFGFETRPFSFLSDATDEKGYFLATLSPSEVTEKRVLNECKAFLDASPLNNCNYPTDFNKGITGADLHSHRFLHHKNMNLYTVGPFVFTSSPKSISNGY